VKLGVHVWKLAVQILHSSLEILDEPFVRF